MVEVLYVYLKRIENGEEIVEDNACLVDGKYGQKPCQAKKDNHTNGTSQSLCSAEEKIK